MIRNLFQQAVIYSALTIGSVAIAQTANPQKDQIGINALTAYAQTLTGEQKLGAEFLLKHLPEQDKKSLSLTLFQENIEQAFIARKSYPWTKELPQDLFFNDVLPHAATTEKRDAWRKKLRLMLHPKLTECRTRLEAYDAVAANIKELTGVSYNTKRKKACQSPEESISQGMASCTGLSILMVDGLRSVGLPARLTAIPLWGTREGNHTWIEFHDGTSWRMAGYGKPSKDWDKGWEIDRSAYCDPAQPIHGIFSSSYKPTSVDFPTSWEWKNATNGDYCEQQRDPDGNLTKLKWNWQPYSPGGIDRTKFYIKLAGGRKIPLPKGKCCIAIRGFEIGGKKRIAIPIRIKQNGLTLFQGNTSNESQDLNEYIRHISEPGTFQIQHQKADGSWASQTIETKANKEKSIKVEIDPKLAKTPTTLLDGKQQKQLLEWFRTATPEQFPKSDWPKINSAEEAAAIKMEIWNIYCKAHKKDQASKELGPLPAPLKKGNILPRSLTIGKHKMPFVLIRKEKKDPPQSGRALYIGLHGGGQNPRATTAHGWSVNTRDWQSQANLAAGVYAGEGIYFIPRMADDRLGRWRHGFNQDAFDLVIEHAIREWNVDPNKVYIMGISQGGYASQLFAPFMPDRFAGICAMAGGIGSTIPYENMLNIAIRSEIGEKDTTFDRIGNCRRYHAKLAELSKANSGGYPNFLNVQKGKGHGIDYSVGPKWMIKHTRSTYPKEVIWTAQEFHGRRRPALYWLGLDGKELKGSIHLKASIKNQNTIHLSSLDSKEKAFKAGTITLMFNDKMIDLNKPVTIIHNGKKLPAKQFTRNVESLAQTLAQRGDPHYSFSATIKIDCL